MCLLAILWRVVDDAPLVLGANREESYDRQGTEPQVLTDEARFVAGLDPKAGGTWLGINEFGVVVAVTNGPKSSPPPQPRSRGLLTRDLLKCKSASMASRQAATQVAGGSYAGCNLFCADSESAYIVHAEDWIRVVPIPPGIHVLTRGSLNQPTDDRVQHALGFLNEHSLPTAGMWLNKLKQLCSRTGENGSPPICLRGEHRGTVSSSLIALRSPLRNSTYLHAQGPPPTTPYIDYSSQIRAIT